ncbi:MAG: hypothetical protein ABWX61_07020 [Paenisporosarcina sp.]
MDLLVFIQSLKNKSDEELAAMSKSLPVTLSKKEIKELRPLLETASFSWVFTGIPSSFKKEIAKVIGKSKAKTLFNFYNV